MPYDKTIISNMTLGHLSIGLTIGDFETENSAEADACRLWFDHCTEVLFEMTDWPFATRRVELQELDMDDYPEWEDHWNKIYQYPNFCKRVNRIINPVYRTEPKDEDKIKFRIIDLTTGGKAILCDQEDAIAEYNHLEDLDEIVSRFSASYAHAHSLMMATLAAGRLKVSAQIKADVRAEWSLWLAENINQTQDENKPDVEPASSFEQARA